MVTGPDRRTMSHSQASDAQIDVGLRNYMLRIYQLMGGGLLLSAIVAYVVAHTSLANVVFGSVLTFWVFALAPLGLLLYMNFRFERTSASTLGVLYWVFCALMGISLSALLLRYGGESIAKVFFITAASFGALSLYGYTTKRDLSGFGSFLIMGLFGLIIASVVNIFLGSEMMGFIISVIGVLIFAGLTAYDTQRLKEVYHEAAGHEVLSKIAIMGAVSLYLNFVNLFQFLLALFGGDD